MSSFRNENTGLAEGLQVGGESGLAHLHGIGKLANAKLGLEQGGKDAHTGLIRKGSAEEDDVIHGFNSGNDDMIAEVPVTSLKILPRFLDWRPKVHPWGSRGSTSGRLMKGGATPTTQLVLASVRPALMIGGR